MLRDILVENFKSIGSQTFNLPPLTILTGLNSTGKSSIIQSILLLSKYYSLPAKDSLNQHVKSFLEFRVARNKYKNAKNIKIEATSDKGNKYSLIMDDDGSRSGEIYNDQDDLSYEKKLYYIPANRLGQEEIVRLNREEKIGRGGEYIIGYFEDNKDRSLEQKLVKFDGSTTLKHQVGGWLEEILGIKMEFKTEKVTNTEAKASFNIDGLEAINPFNVGAGNSYVVKILITCLMCNVGDIMLIENPEIHLHPKAQSKLGEFFSWIAERGVQIILETHSEHLINKVRHQVYNKKLGADNVMIYYKELIQKDFIPIRIDERGRYKDTSDNNISFPPGFFDSTLKELLEIG